MTIESKKKIALTGHTAGLGKGLYHHFTQLGFEVAGFSRSNGYDIQDLNIRRTLVEALDKYDVFINCAHAGFAQTELLYLVFEKWRLQSKLIINVSSNSSDGNKNYSHPYAIEKASLDKACEQLNHIPDVHCKIVNLRPGWIKTERIEKLKILEPCLEIERIIEVIEFILKLPPNVHIPSLGIVAR